MHLLEKFNIPKYSQVNKFHVSNFCCFDYPRKFFNSEFLPIYGTDYLQLASWYTAMYVYQSDRMQNALQSA